MLGSRRPCSARSGPARFAPSPTTAIRQPFIIFAALRVALSPHRGRGDERGLHLIRGSTLNWWNGGGEESVHSRVVAPGPHGLSAAFSLRTKACARPAKNTIKPRNDM